MNSYEGFVIFLQISITNFKYLLRKFADYIKCDYPLDPTNL